jgi:heme/copper-type cytochrome/quinol oxidase subunit 2
MTRRGPSWCVLLAALAAACSTAEPWTTREEDLRAIEAVLVPPGATHFFVTLDEASLPEWRVRDGRGISKVTREIVVTEDKPVVLLIRADRDCFVQIPAMRVRKTVVPGRPTVAWFLPVEVGEYDILGQASTVRFDGRLIVRVGTAQ